MFKPKVVINGVEFTDYNKVRYDPAPVGQTTRSPIFQLVRDLPNDNKLEELAKAQTFEVQMYLDGEGTMLYRQGTGGVLLVHDEVSMDADQAILMERLSIKIDLQKVG